MSRGDYRTLRGTLHARRGRRTGRLVVVAADQEPEHESDRGRDGDRGSRVLADVATDVVPEVPVVFLDLLGCRLHGLAHLVTHVVELLARFGVVLSEDFLRAVDLLFHKITGAVEWGFFGHG